MRLEAPLPPEPKRPTLEIPEGAVFELEADGLVIGYKDDVIIRGNPGHRLKKIFSDSGSIEFRSVNEVVVESIETKRGTVVVAGNVRAKSIKGAKVTLMEGNLSVRSLNGEQSIDLQGGTIEADLVMSPMVTVTPKVRGRATVIECQNELGPHALKGGFKMAEFLEMMPSAQKVIQSEASQFPQLAAVAAQASAVRRPAATWAGTMQAQAQTEPHVQAGGDDPLAPAQQREDSSGWYEAGEQGIAAAAGADAPAMPENTTVSEPAPEAPLEEPMAETSLPEPEPPPPPPRPPFHAALSEMCAQIGRVYGAQNLASPPPVAKLTEMVEAGLYPQVKGQLTSLWNQLIQYHKEKKLPFAVKTTQMFQSIQRTLAANV